MHISGKCLSCPATKMAENVDGEGENGGPATKMAENVDEAGEKGGPQKTGKNVDGAGEIGGSATKTAKYVDGAGENGSSATKRAENVDEAAKSWTELALQPLHEAVYAGAGDGEVRGGDDAGLGAYAKAAAHELGNAVDGFFGYDAAAGNAEK